MMSHFFAFSFFFFNFFNLFLIVSMPFGSHLLQKKKKKKKKKKKLKTKKKKINTKNIINCVKIKDSLFCCIIRYHKLRSIVLLFLRDTQLNYLYFIVI